MCSLNDADLDGDALLLREDSVDCKHMICRKCDRAAHVVLRKKDVYCKDCFLAASTHKFRATLGKAKAMKPSDNVLVTFSGSQGCVALLHLLYSGLNEDHHKKLLFKVAVLFIDEGAILQQNQEERQETFEAVKNLVGKFKFPLHVTTLCVGLYEAVNLSSNLVIDEAKDTKLKKLFEGTKQMSSKEDLLCRLRQKIYVEAAGQLGCNKVFTAEAGTDLAVKLLSCISLGRGGQLPLEVGFCDSRHSDIKVIRPLRDFMKKEVAFYNCFHDVEALHIPSLTTLQSANSSIQKLTEKFVTELQEEFPATVYTIFRTGDKLSISEDLRPDNSTSCLMCGCGMNSARTSYDAAEARQLCSDQSRSVYNDAKERTCCFSGVRESADNGSCCSQQSLKAENLTKADLMKSLCYGCGLIIKDMDSLENLPRHILTEAKMRRDFEFMKEEISDFLL